MVRMDSFGFNEVDVEAAPDQASTMAETDNTVAVETELGNLGNATVAGDERGLADNRASAVIKTVAEMPLTSPIMFALFNAVLYYADFGTDLNFAVEIANPVCNTTAGEVPPPAGLVYVVIGVIALHFIFMSVADLRSGGGMGWRGVLLNVLHVRMLYAVYGAIASGGGKRKAAAAARSANDVKLFEAVYESMPQLFVQFAVLLLFGDCIPDKSIYSSLIVSSLSISLAIAIKFAHLFNRNDFGKSDDVWFTAAAMLYFLTDSVSRGLAVAMFLGAVGSGKLVVGLAAWLCCDLFVQWWFQGDWGAVKNGKCGVRCCWDGQYDGEYGGGGDCCASCSLDDGCVFCDSDGWSVQCPIYMITDLDAIWDTTAAGPYDGSISIPASFFSLFTAMPLSTRDGDRDRLFVLSTVATLAMAVPSLWLGFDGGAAVTAPSESAGSSGSGLFSQDVLAEDIAEEDVRHAVTPATTAVVFAMLAVKVLVYLVFFRRGVLRNLLCRLILNTNSCPG